MLAKRRIPCLDIRDGQTVKGINFVGLKQVGDPVELGAKYAAEGADELVYLDISASEEGRRTFTELVSRIAARIDIPFTVGGGISSVDDAGRLLDAGADKVTLNSAAVADPALIDAIAAKYGSQFVVAAIDARTVEGRWVVTTHGGKRPTDRELFAWAREAADRGAGEILFTSMDHDGTKNGYPCDTFARLAELPVPIIASGGAGTVDHIADVLTLGRADAALAASIFHYNEIPIPVLKIETKPFSALDAAKLPGGLVPAVIQDARTLQVLMLGYMNEEAYNKSLAEGRVTFYSRSRQCLWTKGETSGNWLDIVSVAADCDNDTLLVRVIPHGPTCHTGSKTCFGEAVPETEGFIRYLQSVIQGRHAEMPEGSYTSKLFNRGVNKIAQKVGEEAVETVIEAVAQNREAMIYEASDLIYHLLVLLEATGCSIADLEKELARRHS